MVLTRQERQLAPDDKFPTAQLLLLGMCEYLPQEKNNNSDKFSNMPRCRAYRLDFHLPILMGDGQGLQNGE